MSDNNVKPKQDPAKQAKLAQLEILRGNTAGNVTAVGPLKKLGVNAKKKMPKK